MMKDKPKKVNTKNRTSGITLIALVITIIVLLILAGVTLASLSGENGLLSRSSQAKEEAVKAQLKEEIEMAIMDIQTEELPKGNNVTIQSLAEGQLQSKLEDITAELGEPGIVGEYKGYEYTIDGNLNVTIVDKVQGISFRYTLNPNGWTKEDITLTINASSSNGKIESIKCSISDVNKIEEKENKDGKATYTIKENGEYEFEVTDGIEEPLKRTIVIDKIDKKEPTEVTVDIDEETITATGFTVKVKAKDNESGIGRYEYCVTPSSGGEEKKYKSTESTYNINDLQQATEYSVYVIVYDKAENSKASSHITKKTQREIEIIDYWPLTSNLNNTKSNRDNMQVTEGTVTFNDGMYLDGNSTVETINNYILPSGEFSITMQIKDITKFSQYRYAWILNIGATNAAGHEKNDFGFVYDSHYPNILFSAAGVYSGTNNGEGILPLDGEWHTLTGVYNGSKISLYIDNTIVPRLGNISKIKTDLSSKMGISRSNTSVSKLQGYFRKLIVYNKALTSDEINEMLNK